ncbi:hypothetical protein WJX84_011912 [Apatococcus fuscideae]|uniref:UTP25 C-terminal domain-containing protein n=1 Tax=Apatococcus fuscideae TaxID=2026836 RepID=A0AAW1SPW6_9CHLO
MEVMAWESDCKGHMQGLLGSGQQDTSVSEYQRPRGGSSPQPLCKGRSRLLLYSERLHFYFRHHFRGVQDVVFYQLPEHAKYYSELVDMMADGGQSGPQLGHATATAIFSKYDSLGLQQVCGSRRAQRMLKSDNPAFMFC